MRIFGNFHCVILAVLTVLPLSQSYRIWVEALGEECFYEKVEETGNKSVIGFTYEVIDGGFLDIDTIITGPDGETVYSRERDGSGRIAFAVTKPGIYTYCFSNKMSTVTPKEVMFSFEVGEKDKPLTQDGDYNSKEMQEIQPEKLEPMIKELRTVITGIKHEQEYMEVRDRIHIRINESTNQRVVTWVVFEFIMVLCVTISQVAYLKRFFEVRRVI